METSPPSLPLGQNVIFDPTDKVDRISNLPKDVLLKIISELTTDEAIRTSVLSKTWENLWKDRHCLFFDMRKIININGVLLPSLLDRGAAFITEIINNHNRHLECGIIYHYSYQMEDGMLNSWVQLLTSVKRTKNLALKNFLGQLIPEPEINVLNLPANTFSYPELKTLSLSQYILRHTHAFNDCQNITSLELNSIFSEVDVFNNLLSSCPSLEVLTLHIHIYNRNGTLKINHKKLKMLLMFCNEINGIEIIAPRLDILSIAYALCARDNVVLEVPRLRFRRNYWVAGGFYAYTSHNISCPPKEKESNGDEITLTRTYVTKLASLSVSVDLKNPQEIAIFKETLRAWDLIRMMELEIVFKNNNSLGDDEETNLWETVAKPFPSATFQVNTMWMYNFSGSSKEEFALVSMFVMQKTVLHKIMILTTSFPAKKKLLINEAVAKLKEIANYYNKELSIECF